MTLSIVCEIARSHSISWIQEENLSKILLPRVHFMEDLQRKVERSPDEFTPTVKRSLIKKLEALHLDFRICEGMDPTNLSRRVNKSVIGVDRFIESITKDGTRIDDVRKPSQVAKISTYAKIMGESLLWSNPSEEHPHLRSTPELYLKSLRDIVSSLIQELKPLHRGCVGTETFKSPVLYVTDRPLTVDGEYSRLPQPRETLHYGRMLVSIPGNLRRGGKLEVPQTTDSQHYLEPFVRICGDKQFFGDRDAFFRKLNAYINEEAGCPDVLIFIPGYNSLLKKNVRRLAKLKKDLDFEGTVVLYSWTSAGSMSAYYSDEKTVCATTSLLCNFILDIQREIQITSCRIHLMAHSMGNRALIGALRRLQNRVDRHLIGRVDLPNICQAVFVAADVHVADFIDLVEGLRRTSHHAKIPILTVYCTNDDYAIMLSKEHCDIRNQDSTRLGSTQSCIESSEMLDADFVDVVDATGVATTSTLRHSYFCEVPDVLDDLKDIFTRLRRAEERQRLQELRILHDSPHPLIMYTFDRYQFSKETCKHIFESVSRHL